MKAFRKIVILFVVLCITLGCQYKVPKDPYTLVMPIEGEPNVLNPLLSTSGYEYEVFFHIFESLFSIDWDTLGPKPQLAERWEVSEDKTTYIFYLRKDVRWHDGVPFTADDVVFTFETLMNPKVDAARLRNYFANLSQIEKVDDYTVRLVFQKSYFQTLMVCGGFQILPKHIFENLDNFNSHPFNRNPIGTGPFKFDYWKTGREIVVNRNDDYWGEKPKLNKIVYKIISDNTVALQEMKKGELDILSVEDVQWLYQINSEKFKNKTLRFKYFAPTSGYSFTGWNLRRPYFADVKVRQALAQLIDVKMITGKLSFGLNRQVTGPFFIEGNSYNSEVSPFSYNPQEAMRLLEEAGWIDHDGDGIRDKDGVPFKFVVTYANQNLKAERLYSIMKEDFKKVGILVDSQKVEWALFTKYLTERNFDAVILSWLGTLHEDQYQVFHSSQIENGSNFVGYANQQVDELLETARFEFDPQKRSSINKEIQAIIYNDQPYLFLNTAPQLLIISNRFSNVIKHRGGFDILEWDILKEGKK